MGGKVMMKRKLSSLTFIFAILLSIFPVMSSAQAAVDENRAFEDLTRCISTKKVLDVYYLIDQSGSLKQTDKNDDRADILASSLSALGDFDSDVTVNYAVTFFGDKAYKWASWSQVDEATIDGKAAALRAEIRKPSRKSDFNTNWLVGLEQAKNDLAAQASQSKGCQALIWLTDGGIFIQKDGSREISEDKTSAAVARLCSEIVPAMRKSQVSIFGVLLKNNAQIDALDNEDRVNTLDGMSHMFPIVEGEFEGTYENIPEDSRTCGVTPVPANQPQGKVLIAKDPVSLALQFLVLTAATQGGIEATLPPGNPTNFKIDKGVRKFELVSTTQSFLLTGPSGQSYTGSAPGVEVSQSGVMTTIDVQVGPQDYGQWKFKFDTGAQNKLFLFSGLDVRVNRSGFVAGENGTLSGNIITKSNVQPVDISAYKKADLKIEIVKSDGTINDLAKITPTNGGNFKLSDFKPLPGQTSLELRLTMPLETTGGTKLKPISVTQVINIPDRSHYPTLSEVPITFSDLKDVNKGSGEIKIVGPSIGGGKVCFKNELNNGVTTTLDQSRKERSFTYRIVDLPADGCISVGEGENKTLTIEASTSIADEAGVEALLPMASYSDTEPDGLINDEVPMELTTSLEKAWEWLIKLLLYFLGIALPWVFSYVINRSTTKIAFGPKVQRATIPVSIHSTKGVTAPDGSSIQVRAEDFKFIPEQDDTNLFVDPLGQMRAKVSFNILRAPWFEVAANPGFRLITMIPAVATLKKRFATGQIAPMKGNIENFWALQVSDADLINPNYSTAVPATLLIYKRNKLSQPNQHIDVVNRAAQTPGIWSQYSALPKTVEALKVKADKEGKGSKKKTTLVMPVEPKVEGSIPPPPPGMAPPPPPPPNLG